MNLKKTFLFLFPVAVGSALWMIPVPQGLSLQAWHLLAIFLATMFAVILKPLPMSVVSLLSLTTCVLTHTLSFADAFSGFSNEVVWLVLLAFFIARGLIQTGLGTRVAYLVMRRLGTSPLGLGYGLVATDLLLAPTIPSVTARLGGIVFPIVKTLSEIFLGKFQDPKMGKYLTLCAFQGSTITSALFLTSMAGNPLIAEMAKGQGIELTWGGWALASLVPGLLSLALVPYLLLRWISPASSHTLHAKTLAEEKLQQMGKMRKQEWMVLAIFFSLLVLWILGSHLGLSATGAALIGLSLLLLTGILKGKDLAEEPGAWDTFIWFASLVTLATYLNKLGVATWFSEWVVAHVQGWDWKSGFLLISLVYFYSHYFFASNVAHIGAMYVPLLIVSIALGTPGQLAALILAFFSSLFGGLTHYGCGPAPILFGTGTVSVGEWWKVGGALSVFYFLIWTVVGGLWWKFLGLW